MIKLILTLCCLVFIAPPSLAQVGKAETNAAADPRVKTQLDQIGYKYQITAEGDYKLVPIQTEAEGTNADGTPKLRSQLVYVNSNTEKYGSLEIREVLAPAMLVAPPLSVSTANRLLLDNNKVKFGAWRLVSISTGANSGKVLVMFAAQIDANADAESLRLTIKSVILIADRMEKELTHADDY
jgi:hypothetical protein